MEIAMELAKDFTEFIGMGLAITEHIDFELEVREEGMLIDLILRVLKVPDYNIVEDRLEFFYRVPFLEAFN